MFWAVAAAVTPVAMFARMGDTARRVAAGEVKPGFQTPSLAFGADYILNFDGVTREDLNS